MAGAPASILGRPVVIDPVVANIGSANKSVVYADVNQSYVIRTAGLQLMWSDHFAAQNDLVSFRATLRCDGDLIDGTANSAVVVDTD